MKINYIGYNFTHKPKFKLSRPNGASSNIFINIKKPARFVIGSEETRVSANTVVIIKKGTPHWYEYEAAYGTDDWFHFDLSDEEEEKYNLPYNSVLVFDDAEMISFLISKMHYEFYSNNINKEQKINSYFDILCCEINEKQERAGKEIPYNFSLYNVRANIYNKPERRFSNQYFADQVGMSISHFQRTYKKLFNVSPNRDMILSRIERAKYLLKNTNYTVTDIARELNYENEVQLYRQFKNTTGMTALEYRKKYH